MIPVQFEKLIITSLLLLSTVLGAPNNPFPVDLNYGTKPTINQTTMNTNIKSRYDLWKTKYLVQHNSSYYIKASDTDGDRNIITVSEAHGYGMMIVAMMAGYDANAKTYFDGMVTFYDTYTDNNNLMGWRVWDDFTSDTGSATDGDGEMLAI